MLQISTCRLRPDCLSFLVFVISRRIFHKQQCGQFTYLDTVHTFHVTIRNDMPWTGLILGEEMVQLTDNLLLVRFRCCYSASAQIPTVNQLINAAREIRNVFFGRSYLK